MYWNWNRIKLVLVLLLALWTNHPVTWARTRATAPPKMEVQVVMEGAAGDYNPAPFQPQAKPAQNPAAHLSPEVALAYVELAKLENLLALENEMIRGVENDLAQAERSLAAHRGDSMRIAKAWEEQTLLQSMREQARALHDNAQRRLILLVEASGRRQAQVSLCVRQ